MQKRNAMNAEERAQLEAENHEAVQQVSGHLVTFPLRFLQFENWVAGITIESLLPNYVFQ